MTDSKNTLKMILLSCLIGIVVAFGAIGFYWLVEVGKHVFLGMIAGYYPQEPAGAAGIFHHSNTPFRRYLLFFLPCLGGFLGGILVHFFAPDAKGHGTDGVIDSYHHRGGKINGWVPLIKAAASAITIGTGGSAGKEGPISQIGAGLASTITKYLTLTKRQKRVLVMVGLAAGVGAIFRAPLAAALFASEVLYKEMDFEEEILLPAIASSIIAYAVFASQFGWTSLFSAPHMTFQNPWQLIPYTLVALVVSQSARGFIGIYFYFDRWFAGLTMPGYMKPAIGGLLTGCIGYAVPDALAEGYGVVQNALNGQVALEFLAIVVVAKVFTTTFTITSGASGGMFGPVIVIGACLGGVVGIAAEKIFPFPLDRGAFVLLGMAGFFASTCRVPIASIIMISEITGSYQLIVPTMWVSILSFLLNRDKSIFEKQIPTRFDAPSKTGEMMTEILSRMKVRDVYRTLPKQTLATMKENHTIQEVVDIFLHNRQIHYPVIDEDNKFLGVIDKDEVRRFIHEKNLNSMLIASDLTLPAPSIGLDERLHTAIQRMITWEQDEIVIWEKDKPIGILKRGDIIGYYDKQMRLGETTTAIDKKVILAGLTSAAEAPETSSILHLKGVHYNLLYQTKKDIFYFLLKQSSLAPTDQQIILMELLERENKRSTGIGEGIAFPHSRCSRAQKACSEIIIGVLTTPIDFSAIDEKPVDIICMVLYSDGMVHLEVMKKLALCFTYQNLAKKLRASAEIKEILEIVK